MIEYVSLFQRFAQYCRYLIVSCDSANVKTSCVALILSKDYIVEWTRFLRSLLIRCIQRLPLLQVLTLRHNYDRTKHNNSIFSSTKASTSNSHRYYCMWSSRSAHATRGRSPMTNRRHWKMYYVSFVSNSSHISSHPVSILYYQYVLFIIFIIYLFRHFCEMRSVEQNRHSAPKHWKRHLSSYWGTTSL